MSEGSTDGASTSQVEGGTTLYAPGADPGLKYLKDITLSPEEEAEYTRLSEENVTGMNEYCTQLSDTLYQGSTDNVCDDLTAFLQEICLGP